MKRPDLAAMNVARRIDLSGQRFGRLIALEPRGRDKYGALLWLCACDCGEETLVKTGTLRRGATKSCGCAQRERRHSWNRSHAGSGTRLYRIWQGMVTRTTNPKNRGWTYYGSRGIRICGEWQDFGAFREWALSNGYDPSLSIDRIDNDGDYEPGNCRWATQQMQVSNRRTNAEMERTRNMQTFKIAAAQGEVNIRKIDTLPDVALDPQSPEDGAFVIGHSESGNTHVIDALGVTVMERTKGVPAGLRELYAIVKNPTVLRQNASTPHETIKLDPGIYSFKISREFDPFLEQARMVAD